MATTSANQNAGSLSLLPVSKNILDKMRTAYETTLRAMSTAQLKLRFPDRPDIEEVQSSWVSIKDLQQLIDDNSGCDGLRIYYGCYHEKTKTDDFTYEYEGLHNLIFVTTTSDGISEPSPLNSRDNLSDDVDTGTAVINGFKNLGGNKIPLCPPNC